MTKIYDEKWGEEQCEAARKMFTRHFHLRYELGGILHELYHREIDFQSRKDATLKRMPFWQTRWPTWAVFCEQKLRIPEGAASRLVRIWRKFGVELRGKWERRLLRCETAMDLLVPVVDETNVQHWMETANRVGLLELRVKVRQTLRAMGKVTAKMTDYPAIHGLTITLREHQHPLVDEVLDRLAEERGCTKGDALFDIVVKYVGAEANPHLRDVRRRLERATRIVSRALAEA